MFRFDAEIIPPLVPKPMDGVSRSPDGFSLRFSAMAKLQLQPQPPDNDPGSVADDFQDGMNALAADVWWRWLATHMRQFEDRGLKQCDVAVSCNLDEAGFGKFLNRKRRITIDALVRLQHGLSRLCQRHGVAFQQLAIPDDRAFAIAGWLHALNGEGERQCVAANQRPIGAFRYYCLRAMFGNEAWYKAVAGQFASKEMDELARQIAKLARDHSDQVAHALCEFERSDAAYPSNPSNAELRELARVWIAPWRAVYTVMGGDP